MQLATALKFYRDDFVTGDGALKFLEPPKEELPSWVGKDKACKDGDATNLYVGNTVPKLDACAQLCEKQPGCYVFLYSEKSDQPETCQWQKTLSWGRCDNSVAGAESGVVKGLFSLRAGAYLRRLGYKVLWAGG